MSNRSLVITMVCIGVLWTVTTLWIYQLGISAGLSYRPKTFEYELVCLTDWQDKGVLYINPKIIQAITDIPADSERPVRTRIDTDDNMFLVKESAQTVRQEIQNAKMIGKESLHGSTPVPPQ